MLQDSAMLDLRHVCEQPEEVRAALKRRGFGEAELLGEVEALALQRRQQIVQLEELRAERNLASDTIARLDKRSVEFAERRQAMRALGERIAALESQWKALEAALTAKLLHLPNLPHASVPDGVDETHNPQVSVWGEVPQLPPPVRDHVELGERLGLLDFQRAGKLSGARFVVLRGALAKLERALLQWMLDVHTTQHGYEEFWLPSLVLGSALRGTGQLPKFADDLFQVVAAALPTEEGEGRQLYLSPTAEVQLTNLHADEILAAAQLPLAYTAYSACFRSEAGSYGRDTRGMIRQHQFDKVELVRFCRPEEGAVQLELLRGHAEAVLQQLSLHYRVVELCTGDLGFNAQKTYDLEVWLPSQKAFREISSCSWFGDFQARRAGIRYRQSAAAKPQLVHTVNGSGLAVGRTLVAILEQHQRADGSVWLPDCLRPYMGGLEAIGP